MTELDEAKTKFQLMKEKLALKERMLAMKERKKRVKRFSEVGKIAYSAGIDQLDQAILLGAFLEISSQLSEKLKIDHWKRLADEFSKEQETEKSGLIISFQNPPSDEIRTTLKEMKFRWNKFRGEYYGYGEKKLLDELLKTCQANIEVVSNVQ